MKKLSHSFLFLLIGFYSFAQETEKLPKFPWEDIVEMKIYDWRNLRKWNSDINIKLKGNFTEQDSVFIEKIIKKLNALTETVSIKISNSENSNYKIYFSDFYRTTEIQYKYNQNLDRSANNEVLGKRISALDMFVHKKSEYKDNDHLFSLLEVFIAKTLVTGSFSYDDYHDKHLIFKSHYYNLGDNFRLTDNYLEVFNYELKIIKEVYKKDFYIKLKKAEKQYKEVVEKRIETKKSLNRDRSFWWVRNPIAIIILPALLFVLMSIYVLGRIKTFLSSKIKKDWLQFGILAIVLLFFADIIIILSVSTFDFLTIPDDYTKVPFIRNDTIITTIILSSISIPILFLFRFIESKIQEKANSILVKTFLIFVSTGFLPFIFLCTIFITSLGEGQNKQGGYTTLANMFVGLMILATIRALISYFIFKERSLIVENENKLSHLRELKTKAELKSLQSQINPHFLYNSLNSIASLAPIDAQKTQKMAHSLSDLFKYAINRKGKKMSTIQDEIEMVNSYLEIEKIRFGDRLQFVIEVEEALKENEIPLFLIQPLVENAVKHGISKNKGIGKIVLKIEEDKNELFIRVLDNGPDFPEGLISGHGLQTVYDLLRLSYGDKAGLYWTNNPEKMIIIRIANNEKDE